jgi:hypothetical protein
MDLASTIFVGPSEQPNLPPYRLNSVPSKIITLILKINTLGKNSDASPEQKETLNDQISLLITELQFLEV